MIFFPRYMPLLMNPLLRAWGKEGRKMGVGLGEKESPLPELAQVLWEYVDPYYLSITDGGNLRQAETLIYVGKGMEEAELATLSLWLNKALELRIRRFIFLSTAGILKVAEGAHSIHEKSPFFALQHPLAQAELAVERARAEGLGTLIVSPVALWEIEPVADIFIHEKDGSCAVLSLESLFNFLTSLLVLESFPCPKIMLAPKTCVAFPEGGCLASRKAFPTKKKSFPTPAPAFCPFDTARVARYFPSFKA